MKDRIHLGYEGAQCLILHSWLLPINCSQITANGNTQIFWQQPLTE